MPGTRPTGSDQRGAPDPMPDHVALETKLLRSAYAAFNARDIDAAVALMTADVEWPRGIQGRVCPRRGADARLLDGAVERDQSPCRARGFPSGSGRTPLGRRPSGRTRPGWNDRRRWTCGASVHLQGRFDSTNGGHPASPCRPLTPAGGGRTRRSRRRPISPPGPAPQTPISPRK